jgi:hypothetical protein
MRLRVISVCAVFVLLLAGCALADESEIVTAITNYGLSRQGGESGNTITITGSVSKSPNDLLYLNDISGFVIDWKADLTVTANGNRPGKGFGMINFTNGEFKLTGGTIKLPTSSLPTNSGDQWVDAIYASENATVTVEGGRVTGDRATDTGINVPNGTLVINGGKITIPRGNMLLAKNLTVNDTDALNGLAIVGDGSNYTITVHGHATTVPASEVLNEDYDDDDDPLPDSIYFVVPNSAVWDIEGIRTDMTAIPNLNIVKATVESGGTLNLKNTDWTFKGYFEVEQNGTLNVGTTHGDSSRLTHLEGTATNDGTINIYGTLTNLDKIINNGIINNYSGKTLDNQGTLTNNGAINNASTGKIRNTGSIDNANGEIDNTAGGTFESVQSASEMGGDVAGPVELINNNTSSGGGCNTGFGLFGLLFLVAFAVYKKHLMA